MSFIEALSHVETDRMPLIFKFQCTGGRFVMCHGFYSKSVNSADPHDSFDWTEMLNIPITNLVEYKKSYDIWEYTEEQKTGRMVYVFIYKNELPIQMTICQHGPKYRKHCIEIGMIKEMEARLQEIINGNVSNYTTVIEFYYEKRILKHISQ